MGLNEIFDNVISQILVVDPLPSVNRAYSIVLRVEKQRNIETNISENLENSVMVVKIAHEGLVFNKKRG